MKNLQLLLQMKNLQYIESNSLALTNQGILLKKRMNIYFMIHFSCQISIQWCLFSTTIIPSWWMAMCKKSVTSKTCCDLKEISNFSFRPPSLCTNAYATHGCIDTSNDLFCVILKQNMLYLCKQIKHLFYLFDLSLLKESVFYREGPTNSSFMSTKIGRVTNKQASPET